MQKYLRDGGILNSKKLLADTSSKINDCVSFLIKSIDKLEIIRYDEKKLKLTKNGTSILISGDKKSLRTTVAIEIVKRNKEHTVLIEDHFYDKIYHNVKDKIYVHKNIEMYNEKITNFVFDSIEYNVRYKYDYIIHVLNQRHERTGADDNITMFINKENYGYLTSKIHFDKIIIIPDIFSKYVREYIRLEENFKYFSLFAGDIFGFKSQFIPINDSLNATYIDNIVSIKDNLLNHLLSDRRIALIGTSRYTSTNSLLRYLCKKMTEINGEKLKIKGRLTKDVIDGKFSIFIGTTHILKIKLNVDVIVISSKCLENSKVMDIIKNNPKSFIAKYIVK